MRVVIYDDEHPRVGGREFEVDAVVMGSTKIVDDGYESQCFIAGPGAAILRALNAIIVSVPEKSEIMENFIGAKMSGALDTTKGHIVEDPSEGDDE